MIAQSRRSITDARRGAVALSALVAVLALLAAAGVAWWLGYLRLPGLERYRAATGAAPPTVSAAESRQGKVAVPLAARNVAAYTRVTRDVFWDPAAKAFSSVWLDAETVKERRICTAEQALNRVLAVDKQQGYIFSEDDFLPPGTRESPTAGIEEDMRGLRVPVDRIHGLHGLARNDRFDLIATRPVDIAERRRELGEVAPLASAQQAELDVWETSTRILVQNGKVVEPVRVRAAIAGSRPAAVEEIFIAVHRSEITLLTEALALGAEIHCVPRSSLPGGGEADLELHVPEGGPGVVEVLSNGRRRLNFVPLAQRESEAEDSPGERSSAPPVRDETDGG